jgi:hypothetical protein
MIQLRLNGGERSFDGDPEMRVLWYVRDILGGVSAVLASSPAAFARSFLLVWVQSLQIRR